MNKGWVQRWGRDPRMRFWLPLALAFALMLLNVLINLDFVKDDAYITWRYAQNLLLGNGLVFNRGEYVEGSTTFLWIWVALPFEALGLDLFQVFEILGTAMLGVVMFLMAKVHTRAHGVEPSFSHAWGPIWMASSSTATLWVTSGTEQPLSLLLPTAAFYLTFEAIRREPEDERKAKRFALGAGVVMGLGCITRPEIHLIGIILGAVVVLHAIRTRRLSRVTVLWIVGLLAVTAPTHGFRYAYYGDLFPNPFYVKTSSSPLIVRTGLRQLNDMLEFNMIGALAVCAPLAFADRKHLAEKLTMATIAIGFGVYIVYVGADEMRWHRLYLPALPMLAMLAGFGIRNVVVAVRKRFSSIWAWRASAIVAWCVVGAAATNSTLFSVMQMGGLNGRGELSGTFHPDLGKFLVRHERPGALVAFQDMGSTPYHAQDIGFLDFIGLTDRHTALARRRYGLHAFAQTEADRRAPEWRAEMREYFHERNPEWAILTTYVHGNAALGVGERFARDPTDRSLRPYIAQNGHQYGIYDARFQQNYVHVRTWPRSITYYLSLFRRRDLWDQTPREVVLDEAPASIGGAQATFDHGLRLLGVEMETEAIERHEFFMTTWWEVAGPSPPDTFFFVHADGPSGRIGYDHVPGDWMYPANRWRPGEIIENRVLVQVPVGYQAGDYEVYLGVYQRASGERWNVVEGEHEDNRVHVGRVTIRTLLPLVHSTIPRTDLDEMRAHPDRIIDHGRQPGE